jgi:hypothetical protein
MLYVEPKEIEVVPADRRTICVACRERQASWRMKVMAGGFGEFCGWCALYSGETRWAHENRDEVAHLGEYVRGMAMKSVSKSVVVPELDGHHRLDQDTAERQIMAIIFTSRMLAAGPFGRLVKRGAELVDDGDL